MSTMDDIEQPFMNGYREPLHAASPPEVPRDFHELTDPAPGQQASGAPDEEASISPFMKLAKDLSAKVKDAPYLVPIAIGGVAFTIGVLVSSRILRNVVFMAGTYAIKEAIANVPKGALLDLAMKVIGGSPSASRATT